MSCITSGIRYMNKIQALVTKPLEEWTFHEIKRFFRIKRTWDVIARRFSLSFSEKTMYILTRYAMVMESLELIYKEIDQLRVEEWSTKQLLFEISYCKRYAKESRARNEKAQTEFAKRNTGISLDYSC